MRSPHWTVVGSAEAAPGDKGVAIRQPLSFDEQLVESGMRAVRSMRRKSELDVTGQLQLTRFARRIHQSHSSDFRVVFGGDDNFCDRLARSTPPPKLRFVRRETPGVTALRRSHRLMCVAPSRSTFQIADVAKQPRHVASRIGAPARHVQVQPAQVAAAGVGHRSGAGSVGEEMNARRSDLWYLRHGSGTDRRYWLPHGSFFMRLTSRRQNLFRDMFV
ncbi:MAG: hypothetical protein Udaeo_06110 [Candidatus Udaeobacter sp.]|nr:MAG: hypothetical protein Udaeo_06110 [Candidatus Udaeobacter sp.]